MAAVEDFSFHVPLYEVDIGGGVYHGNYFHFFEQAREHFLKAIGFSYPELVAAGYHLTVAEVTLRYFKSLNYSDLCRIQTTMQESSTRSLTLIQQIYRNQELCTEARFALVCIDRDGQACEMPKPLQEALSLQMAGVT